MKALKVMTGQRISLASQMQDSSVEVDAEAGIIRNCALITKGVARPCNADPFDVDEQTLADAVRIVNAEEGGLRSRITHPEVEGNDGILKTIGTLRNARRVGESARVDIHLADYASRVPGLGDVKSYLLALAAEQPAHMGLSVVIDAMSIEDNGAGSTRARFHRLFAGDVVGEPGGNPRGLLSRSPATAAEAGGTTMTEAQLEYLRTLGLPDDATEAEATAFAGNLDAEQKAKFEAAASASAAEGDGAEAEAEAETAGAVAAASNRTLLTNGQIKELKDLAKLSDLGAEVALDWIEKGVTPERARAAALKARAAKQGTESVRPSARADVEVGRNLKRESLSEGIRDAILLKAGHKISKPHDRAREFRSLRLVNMAREFFTEMGLRVRALADGEIAMLAISGRRQQEFMARGGTMLTAGDYASYYNTFSNTLVDAQNKALQISYAEATPKWPRFCAKATAPDFKSVYRPRLNAMPALVATDDGDVVSYATIGDEAESYALVNYTSGWVLTFKNLTNDNLDAFSKLPRMAAHKAVMKQDALAFAVLTSGPDMADGEPIFSFQHANVIYAGAVPSVAQIQLMQAKAMAQTANSDDASDPLDFELGVFVVPAALDATMRQVAFSLVDPASSGAAGNPYVNQFDVVSSARLTGNPWYGLVKPNTVCETIELCFLEGFEAPRLDMEEDFDAIAQKHRLFQPMAAKALDHRGMVKNLGTATSASTT